MNYCYPDATNHRFDIFDWTSGEVPTDYYYADLSSSDAESWDLDNDGYYGEYGTIFLFNNFKTFIWSGGVKHKM